MNLEEKIFRKETIERYNQKISSLGPTSKLTITNFLISRFFIELVLFIMFLLIPKYGLLIGIIVTITFHFLYGYILIDSNIKLRNNNLYDESLIFFRMLKLSLKNTNDLRKSLEIVSTKSPNNSFAIEFAKTLQKNKYNSDLSLIFQDMQYKISNQDIIVSLIDLSKTSNPFNTLDNIINNLQEKNNILTKQKYSKLPFILSLISIMLIVSFVLIVIELPNILQFY